MKYFSTVENSPIWAELAVKKDKESNLLNM